jgi:predicted nucleic acid-binding protein
VIVVDSNILAYLYLPGDFTAAAEGLLVKHPKWGAPVLWRSEFRNVLAGYLRRNTITFTRACNIQTEAENLMSGAEFEVDSLVVMQLVHESDCSAYDCEFIALAMQLKCNLVTMDKKLLRAFPLLAVSLAGSDK